MPGTFVATHIQEITALFLENTQNNGVHIFRTYHRGNELISFTE